jgi:hypothetical protein
MRQVSILSSRVLFLIAFIETEFLSSKVWGLIADTSAFGANFFQAASDAGTSRRMTLSCPSLCLAVLIALTNITLITVVNLASSLTAPIFEFAFAQSGSCFPYRAQRVDPPDGEAGHLAILEGAQPRKRSPSRCHQSIDPLPARGSGASSPKAAARRLMTPLFNCLLKESRVTCRRGAT